MFRQVVAPSRRIAVAGLTLFGIGVFAAAFYQRLERFKAEFWRKVSHRYGLSPLLGFLPGRPVRRLGPWAAPASESTAYDELEALVSRLPELRGEGPSAVVAAVEALKPISDEALAQVGIPAVSILKIITPRPSLGASISLHTSFFAFHSSHPRCPNLKSLTNSTARRP